MWVGLDFELLFPPFFLVDEPVLAVPACFAAGWGAGLPPEASSFPPSQSNEKNSTDAANRTNVFLTNIPSHSNRGPVGSQFRSSFLDRGHTYDFKAVLLGCAPSRQPRTSADTPRSTRRCVRRGRSHYGDCPFAPALATHIHLTLSSETGIPPE